MQFGDEALVRIFCSLYITLRPVRVMVSIKLKVCRQTVVTLPTAKAHHTGLYPVAEAFSLLEQFPLLLLRRCIALHHGLEFGFNGGPTCLANGRCSVWILSSSTASCHINLHDVWVADLPSSIEFGDVNVAEILV